MGLKMTGHSMRRSRPKAEKVKVKCPKCQEELEVIKTAFNLPAACPICRIVFDIETGTVIRVFRGDGPIV